MTSEAARQIPEQYSEKRNGRRLLTCKNVILLSGGTHASCVAILDLYAISDNYVVDLIQYIVYTLFFDMLNYTC